MPTSPIGEILDTLRRENDIDQNVILAAIEGAVVEAARTQFNAEQTGAKFRARCDPETGDIEVFALLLVVEEVHNPATEISLADTLKMGIQDARVGDRLDIAKPKEELAGIAAEADTQVILERVREAERDKVYDEYIDRLGELVNSRVKRLERGALIVDLGRIEGVILRAEQSRGESYSPVFENGCPARVDVRPGRARARWPLSQAVGIARRQRSGGAAGAISASAHRRVRAEVTVADRE
jgi:N utilization substance protein A